MNLYEVTIELKGRGGHDIPPTVTQLVLAEQAGETPTGALAFGNENDPGHPVAAFAVGQWVSFRCAEWGVSVTAQRKLRRNEGVWS